jgi:hypothetical protein
MPMENPISLPRRREPWNKGRPIGHKPLGSRACAVRPDRPRAAADHAADAVFRHEVEGALGATLDRLAAFNRRPLRRRHRGDLLQRVAAIRHLRRDRVVFALVPPASGKPPFIAAGPAGVEASCWPGLFAKHWLGWGCKPLLQEARSWSWPARRCCR